MSTLTFVQSPQKIVSPIASEQPPVKKKPAIDVELLSQIDPVVLEDSYVYVHCYFDNPDKNMMIRIWNTTYLMDRASGSQAKLIHAENISFAPVWTIVPDRETFNFLLIFSSLPKSCKHFDLIEQIPQPGGFHINNIHRNINDVYHIDLH